MNSERQYKRWDCVMLVYMTSRDHTHNSGTSGMWRSACWQLFTDVSWQLTGFHLQGSSSARQLDVKEQGWTNLRRQVATVTRFCTAAPNTCGSSVWNLPHVAILAARIWRRLLDIWKIWVPLLYGMHGGNWTFTEFENSVKVRQASLFMGVTWCQRAITINLLKPSGYCMYQFKHPKILHSSHRIFVSFVRVSRKYRRFPYTALNDRLL